MAHTLSRNLVHCVFSTEGRTDLIQDPERLRQYVCGIARAKDIPILAIGGTKNHLHILLALPPAMPLAKVIQEVKGNSSKWLNQSNVKFAWQRGYGAFSVSESKREQVIAYIAGQEEHHRKWTFEQEYVTLLTKSKIDFDPEFVFG
ncbi:MAG TPA: IS200/IS605 family transposase [Terriglobales bacterium]|jgi:REP element-mobilizing transposase RayT